MRRKEYGSDFHYLSGKDFLLKNPLDSIFSSKDFSLFFSGRSALYSIVQEGIFHNWKKIYFPSYYCHEVVEYLHGLDIELLYYDFNPFIDNENKVLLIEDSPDTVIVNVDFFGLKKLNLTAYKKSILIDDLTHNILAYNSSTAHYCFGSLRKELPIPTGGFCYSPKKHALPKGNYNHYSEELAVKKLTAMFLKKQYLEKGLDVKPLFRSFFVEAEEEFEKDFTRSSMPLAAKSILTTLDVEGILKAKAGNIKTCVSQLADIEQIKVNLNNAFTGLGIIIECENPEIKKRLLSHLIENSIYPATLWPNQLSLSDKETEHKVLFLHVDYRYTTDDVLYISNAIKSYFYE